MFSSRDTKLINELNELSERMAEDRIYEMVLREIENNELDAIAKAKAFEEAQGDETKAHGLYTKQRVRRIKDMLDKERLEKEFVFRQQREEEHKQIIEKNVEKSRQAFNHFLNTAIGFLAFLFGILSIFFTIGVIASFSAFLLNNSLTYAAVLSYFLFLAVVAGALSYWFYKKFKRHRGK